MSSLPSDVLRRIREDPVFFCETLLDIHPFPYQREFLKDKSKRIVVCAGRQVGKSLMTSALVLWFAITHPNTTTLVVSASLRQSMITFQKILDGIESNSRVRNSVTRMTRTLVRFKNRSEIKALPCGTGSSLRGHTAHMVVMDEAAFMKENVIAGVIFPMLSTTEGTAIMLSTPFDKSHIFYKAFTAPSWSKYHYPSSINPLITSKFLDEMRVLVGEQCFEQEYLAEFVEDQKAYFPAALLRNAVHSCRSSPCDYCNMLSSPQALAEAIRKGPSHLFGGYDPGGKGDPAAFVVVERLNDENKTLRVVLQKTYLAGKDADENLYTRFTTQIADLHKELKFEKIAVDQTGLGQPIVEHCKELKLPVQGITMGSRSREDIFSNLRIQLEQSRVVLPLGDLNLLANLNCIEAERSRSGGYLFSHPSGTHDDLGVGLALAVWAASGRSPTVVLLGQNENHSQPS
ncbi:MAG: terminase large subunit domain-containing protein [Nitrososphaerales archaeon]